MLAFAVVATSLVAVAGKTDAQIAYRRGQNVAPSFEGWMPNSDGTFEIFFGADVTVVVTTAGQ